MGGGAGYGIVLLALALLASGCGGPPEPPLLHSERPRTTEPGSVPTSSFGWPDRLPPLETLAASERHLGPGDPSRSAIWARFQPLLGLDAARLGTLLGEPHFRRTDSPAELWQYVNSTCILDVFLYRRKKDEPAVVEHVTVRGPSLVRVTPDACIDAVLRTRPFRPVYSFAFSS